MVDNVAKLEKKVDKMEHQLSEFIKQLKGGVELTTLARNQLVDEVAAQLGEAAKPTDGGYFTLDEVAAQLRVGVATVRRYVRDGKLIAARRGKFYYVTKEAINKFIRHGLSRATK